MAHRVAQSDQAGGQLQVEQVARRPAAAELAHADFFAPRVDNHDAGRVGDEFPKAVKRPGRKRVDHEEALVRGDLRGIVRARRLSRATMRNIRQNLFFAFVYNAAGVPIAAGVLYPWFGVLLSPMIASAAMTFSSLSVIVNALRLRSARL